VHAAPHLAQHPSVYPGPKTYNYLHPLIETTQGHSPTSHSAPAFATVPGDMFLQTGDGHRHPHRQLPLFGGLQLAEPYQPPHPIARLDELAFEPSMFRTTYRQTRRRIHPAPVENREPQVTIKANKKQILFFAICSPVPMLGIPRDL
jgi:hypothetical protein